MYDELSLQECKFVCLPVNKSIVVINLISSNLADTRILANAGKQISRVAKW